MSGTIVYDHSPTDTVWVITTDCGVKHGSVTLIKGIVENQIGSPADLVTVWYNILLDDDEGTITVSENVYTEANKQQALDDYRDML